MSSSKEYFDFIAEQLSGIEGISYRSMMGEYIIYYCGKVVGGIYDDQLLVKIVEAAKTLMPDAALEIPYENAKEMLLVENVDDKDFLKKLITSMYDQLPEPKLKAKKVYFSK